MYLNQYGQGLLEYSLIALLVAIVCMGALNMLGGGVNKGFNAILPPSDAMNRLKTATSNLSADTLTTQNQNVGFHNLANHSSSEMLEQYQSIVQTSGSLGNEKMIFAYSDQLVNYASKFAETNPDLYNKIIQLGIAGKQMGQSITTYQLDSSQTNNDSLGDVSGVYDTAWAAVQNSPEYLSLSPADKIQIRSLVGSSMYLADYVLEPQGLPSQLTDPAAYVVPDPSGGTTANSGSYMVQSPVSGAVTPGATVDSNSNQIIICGQNMQCQ